mmetsp:Transcript_53186/g.173015  ORF Transcript_53186/g.173015 Transcript_53186/m.173015 type:complete len:839 (+) Transcript_53186:110-2626(+)|eukprot:CAMPEP_0203883416 /NCGR_PEP_ID=MMETSP0359-20131031/27522_1 /ASSEMBLY_ACC=CAM_ASM_000338 /TAXON_ID=268821 /ORGANISM="Scrippsiella Hangoei, Strain SHTV-5" /LENGTH=838 /DNA_ID=CAMNT_0050803641 /DNA_START=103 /DNA_END=2619 /DNA_ORIENTATION=+
MAQLQFLLVCASLWSTVCQAIVIQHGEAEAQSQYSLALKSAGLHAAAPARVPHDHEGLLQHEERRRESVRVGALPFNGTLPQASATQLSSLDLSPFPVPHQQRGGNETQGRALASHSPVLDSMALDRAAQPLSQVRLQSWAGKAWTPAEAVTSNATQRLEGSGGVHTRSSTLLSGSKQLPHLVAIDADGSVEAPRVGASGGRQDEVSPISSAAFGESGLPPSCSYAAGFGAGKHAPFVFWKEDAGGGGRTYLAPQPDPGGSGVCLFPEASCTAWQGDCCAAAAWVNESVHRSDLWIFVCSLLATLPIMIMVQTWRARNNREMLDVSFDARDGLNYMALYSSLIVNIHSAWIMARWTQVALKVYDRNAMLAAGAFLTPLADVFLFLEDAVSVQIGYAIGTGNTVAAALTLNVGVLGGVTLGALAASLTTALLSWPAAIEALVAPGHHAVGGCSLVPSAAAIVGDAREFWLLTSWSWPFGFANMALSGFFLGTRHYGAILLATLLSKIVLFGVWMGSPQNLAGLAWANAASTVAFFIVSVLVILLYTPLHREYKLVSIWDVLVFRNGRGWRELLFEAVGDLSQLVKVLRQGMQAMLVDLSVQICVSSGIYVASSLGLPALYQVSALQAAMPLYVGCIAGVSYAMKLVSSAMLGLRMYQDYRSFVRLAVLMAGAYAVACVLAIAPHTSPLAFVYAPQACEFASEPGCVATYREVFGGGLLDGGELQETFKLLPAAAAIGSLFSVLKAGLSGCFDFAFMAKAAVSVLLLVYLPAILVALLVYKTPFAVCAAMYLPICALTVIFLVRLLGAAKRIGCGEVGPWSDVDTLGSKKLGEAAASADV